MVSPVVILLLVIVMCCCSCYCCSSMSAGGYYLYLQQAAACFGTPPADGSACGDIPDFGEGTLAGFVGLDGMIAEQCLANADDTEWLDGTVSRTVADGTITQKRSDVCGLSAITAAAAETYADEAE